MCIFDIHDDIYVHYISENPQDPRGVQLKELGDHYTANLFPLFRYFQIEVSEIKNAFKKPSIVRKIFLIQWGRIIFKTIYNTLYNIHILQMKAFKEIN